MQIETPARPRPPPVDSCVESGPKFSAQLPPGSSSSVGYAAMSYADLVQYAERQRQKIDSNNLIHQQKEARLRMIQQNQRTPQAHAAVQARLNALRQEVHREDQELARLRQIDVRSSTDWAGSVRVCEPMKQKQLKSPLAFGVQ